MSLLPIYQDIFKMLFRIAYSRTENLEDAQDIMQDTYLKALISYDPHMTEEHTRKWLVRVTYNNTISYIRQNKKIEPIDDHINEFLSNDWPMKLVIYFADIENIKTSVPGELIKYYLMNIKDEISLLEISKITGITYERLRYWKRIFINDFIAWMQEKD